MNEKLMISIVPTKTIGHRIARSTELCTASCFSFIAFSLQLLRRRIQRAGIVIDRGTLAEYFGADCPDPGEVASEAPSVLNIVIYRRPKYDYANSANFPCGLF